MLNDFLASDAEIMARGSSFGTEDEIM